MLEGLCGFYLQAVGARKDAEKCLAFMAQEMRRVVKTAGVGMSREHKRAIQIAEAALEYFNKRPALAALGGTQEEQKS